MPILFALASLFCGAANDLIFKLYARKQRPVGSYLALIGLIWAGVFTALAAPHTFFHTNEMTLRSGLISGLFSALANILLIEAMARCEVGICSTIYRLNLVPAVILAFWFLGETLSLSKLLGIGSAIGAVLLFFRSSGHPALPYHVRGLWLVMIASLLRAGMGIAYKWGLSSGANPYQLLSINGVVWLISGLFYYWMVERNKVKLTHKTWGYGLSSGALVCGIVLFMILALQRGDASTVLPITQLSFVVTALLGAFLFRELFTGKKVMGLALAVLCVIWMGIDP